MSERLTIARLGHRGDGIADAPSGPIFVPYTLPGEIVEAEAVPGHPDRRHLVRVESVSPERITPICPHFGICGGCAVQHWTEQPYRQWKRNLVVNALTQAQIASPVDDLIDAHGEGRRRAVFHARRGMKDIVETGFAALRAHQIVAIENCPVLAPAMNGALAAARKIAEALAQERKPLDIQVTATDAGLDIDIRGSGPLNAARTSALARMDSAGNIARVTRHGELITQIRPPEVMMGRARVVLPPGSFLQATQAGEAVLARIVCDHAGTAKTIADLFTGVGPFALRLAQRARVMAADSDAAALTALQQAAASTPGLKAVEIQKRDLFRRPLLAQELDRFDAVIFDPPRQGAEAQARELSRSRVRRVIAVSCNPATFARDARILIDGGYRLQQVIPVDQFRYAAHVEVVGRFER